jgi:hypothetical protein
MFRLFVNGKVFKFGKKKDMQSTVEWYRQEWEEKGYTWEIKK